MGLIGWLGAIPSQPFFCLKPNHPPQKSAALTGERSTFGPVVYEDPSGAIDYAKQNSRSHGAVIRAFNEAGNVIETHKRADDFQEPR